MLSKIKKLFLIMSFFLIAELNAQEKPILLNGTVKYNTIGLENINVINKTSKIGTSSNVNGEFAISAIKGDSMLFSSIEYQNRVQDIPLSFYFEYVYLLFQ